MITLDGEEIKTRQMIELNLDAALNFIDPHTGLIHLCYEDTSAKSTIPLFENIVYVLALFKSRQVEKMQEGQRLLHKLLAFQTETGRFPIYLHDYPHGNNYPLSRRIRLPLTMMLERHAQALGEVLASQVKATLDRMPIEDNILKKTYRNFGELVVTAAFNKDQEALKRLGYLWNPRLKAYAGPSLEHYFEKGRPEKGLFDLFWEYQTGVFQKSDWLSNRASLLAALIEPIDENYLFQEEDYALSFEKDFKRTNLTKGFHAVCLKWGEVALSVQDRLADIATERCGNTLTSVYTLYPHEVESKDDKTECAVYLTRRDDAQLLVNGQRATSFALGDTVTYECMGKKAQLKFEIINGEGTFFGHVSFQSRPAEMINASPIPSEAYDFKVSLRTLKRSPHLKMKVSVNLEQFP